MVEAGNAAGSQKTDAGPISLPLAVLTLLAMAVEWILLVAGTRPHEMIVGAFAIASTAAFLAAVHRRSTLRLELRPRDLATCWRIPWYVLSDCFQITFVLLRDVFASHRAESFYRVSGFVTAKHDPLLIARRVLATLYTTATPSFIVIGIDYEQSRMLIHQIERTSIPKMTKALGARS